MGFDEVTILKGKSGAEYLFNIVPRNTGFRAEPGVYVMARAGANSTFQFCFVGHTADLSKRPFNPDKTPCFNSFRADHIFHLFEGDANRRAQIADDLVRAYSPVCNAL